MAHAHPDSAPSKHGVSSFDRVREEEEENWSLQIEGRPERRLKIERNQQAPRQKVLGSACRLRRALPKKGRCSTAERFATPAAPGLLDTDWDTGTVTPTGTHRLCSVSNWKRPDDQLELLFRDWQIATANNHTINYTPRRSQKVEIAFLRFLNPKFLLFPIPRWFDNTTPLRRRSSLHPIRISFLLPPLPILPPIFRGKLTDHYDSVFLEPYSALPTAPAHTRRYIH